MKEWSSNKLRVYQETYEKNCCIDFGSYNFRTKEWDVNYSNVLTKLIKECGRLCDSYASDLFAIWNKVLKDIENTKVNAKENTKYTYVFGIRSHGVDHEEREIERLKQESVYFYRAIYILNLEFEERDCKLILRKVNL